MDWTQAIDKFSDAPAAVAVVGLGFMCWKLLGWWREAVDKRVEDAQENARAHAATTKEVVEGLNSATVAINAATDTIRELRAEVRDLGR